MIGIITAQFGSLEGARFLYIGLFAMGMAGAVVSFGAHAEENAKAYPWKAIWAFLSVLAVAGIIVIDGLYADMLVGLATTALLIYLTLHLRYNAHASQPAVLRILSAPSAVKLGSFSYSLYLTHFPLQTIFLVLLIPYHFSRTCEFVVLTALGTPIILLFAYGFYLVFERPFLFSSHIKHKS